MNNKVSVYENEKQHIEQLAEEAINIAGYIRVDEFSVAEIIAKNTTAKHGPLYWAQPVKDGRWKFFQMITSVWTAGYIAGVRYERKRRREKAN